MIDRRFECPSNPGSECRPADRFKCAACGRTIVGPSCIDCRRKDVEIEALRAELAAATRKLVSIDNTERCYPRPTFGDWSTAIAALDTLTQGNTAQAVEFANQILCAPATRIARELGDAPEPVVKALAMMLRGANGLHPPPDDLSEAWDAMGAERRERWMAYARRVHELAEWLAGFPIRGDRPRG